MFDDEVWEAEELGAVSAKPAAKRRAGRGLPQSPQEQRLWGILQDVNPEWSQKEVFAAYLKLRSVHVDSVQVLVGMIERGELAELNERIKARGKKPFAKKTLAAIWSRVVSELPPERFLANAMSAVEKETDDEGGKPERAAFVPAVAVHPPPVRGARWACPNCKWENLPLAIVCAACEGPRESLTAWLCRVCRHQNGASELRCKHCLESRQTGWANCLLLEDVKDAAEQQAEEPKEAEEVRQNHYELLGISKWATLREISEAFWQCRKKTSLPGHEEDPKQLARLREAYKVLSNPAKRAEYDEAHRLKVADPEPQSRPARKAFSRAVMGGEENGIHEAERLNALLREVQGVDLYTILGLEPSALDRDIEAAYERRAAEVRLDESKKGRKKLAILSKACEVLCNHQTRKRYDAMYRMMENELERDISEPETDQDYYDLLVVEPTAGLPDVLLAFQNRLAEQDAKPGGGNRKKMEQIKEAFNVLTDTQKRLEYDVKRSERLARASAERPPPRREPEMVPSPQRTVVVDEPPPSTPLPVVPPLPTAPEEEEVDLYKALGIKPEASMAEVLVACQDQLMLADGADVQKVATLQDAFDTLTDEAKRRAYDEKRRARLQPRLVAPQKLAKPGAASGGKPLTRAAARRAQLLQAAAAEANAGQQAGSRGSAAAEAFWWCQDCGSDNAGSSTHCVFCGKAR